MFTTQLPSEIGIYRNLGQQEDEGIKVDILLVLEKKTKNFKNILATKTYNSLKPSKTAWSNLKKDLNQQCTLQFEPDVLSSY
jgi:hypothetical protein